MVKNMRSSVDETASNITHNFTGITNIAPIHGLYVNLNFSTQKKLLTSDYLYIYDMRKDNVTLCMYNIDFYRVKTNSH